MSIVDSSRHRAKELAYGLSKALILHGEGTDKNLLESEGAGEADFFIAVTNDENSNILSCLLAKKLGAKRTISLVTNPDYVTLDNQLNIDTVVSQRLLTINKVLMFLRQGNVLGVNEIVEGQIQALEYRVTSHCEVVGKEFMSASFREVFPENVIIGGIVREGEAFIPEGNTMFKENDGVLVFTHNSQIEDLEFIFPVS